jgi:acyl-ACP thioesterase
MDVDALAEMVPPPAGGRTFALAARPGLADCAPSGRIRLDAVARWLQDVAYADVEDAGVAEAAVWVVRRNRLRVDRFPRFGEHHTLLTYCSGVGRMWAERRTTVTREGAADPDIEAVSLWVHLDPVSRLPVPLTPMEMELYGDAAAARRVSHRLRHEQPDEVGERRRWTFRATDLDLADHVNNAAYWQPLEEQLLREPEPERLDVEIEFRVPAQPGDKVVLHDRNRLWILGDEDEVHASIVISAS